jgi:hypothetical protein
MKNMSRTMPSSRIAAEWEGKNGNYSETNWIEMKEKCLIIIPHFLTT